MKFISQSHVLNLSCFISFCDLKLNLLKNIIPDKRTASHIAAAEGNVAAVKVLADFGADLTLEDRWGNSVQGEAERSNARKLLTYLKSASKKKAGNNAGDLSSHGKAA